MRVDARRAARLKNHWRKPMPVRIQVNGKPKVPWRTNMMPIGDGAFYLYLHGAVRKAVAAKVGDIVSLAVRFDTAYRGGPAHPMPAWFGGALNRNSRAKRGWKRLTASRQKEILRYFVGLKSTDARQRNAQRALYVLAGGKARFMARSWNSG